MSRLTIVKCDRCGCEITSYSPKDESAKILLNSPGEYRGVGGQRIDLCLNCYEKFVTFLDGAKCEVEE